MDPTWILVADEARARLFTVERPRGPLIEHEDLVNPPERLRDSELGSDDAGRGSGSGGQRHRLDPRETIREGYVRNFTRDIAQRLKQARLQGEMTRLYLVAAPHMLGALRAALDRATADCVVDTINKDLVQLRSDDLRRHLPERL